MLDGNIEFLGRIDQQVKIRGFRIELGEIEDSLLKHSLIKEAVVMDREEGNGQRFTGVVRWFDPAKGYGFIERDDGAGDVFVHYSEIDYVGFKVLHEGERVEFGVTPDRRGDQAVKVAGHDPFAP